MARQAGDIKLEGTINDITFYKMENRYFVRQKAGVDRKRFMNDPAFLRSRESSHTFGLASAAAGIFRMAFSSLLQDFPCHRLNSAVTGAMVKVFPGDEASRDGACALNSGNLRVIEGFEFNKCALLGDILQVPYHADIDRGRGEARVSVPGFIPSDCLINSGNGTHMKFHMGCAAIHFQDGTYQFVRTESEPIPIGLKQEQAFDLSVVLPGTEINDLPLFLVLGVEFYRKALQKYFKLAGGIYNALQVIRVDVPVVGSNSGEVVG
ncbi:MAG: hypothetical protein AB2L24_07515 [Mangrovibacterium sp.]